MTSAAETGFERLIELYSLLLYKWAIYWKQVHLEGEKRYEYKPWKYFLIACILTAIISDRLIYTYSKSGLAGFVEFFFTSDVADRSFFFLRVSLVVFR